MLLWKIPSELRQFKRITEGHLLVMGRKTWESIGKPLSEREIFVLTNGTYESPHSSVRFGNREELEAYLKELEQQGDTRKVFIAGGEQVYRDFLSDPRLNELFITRVLNTFEEADAFFPEFDDGPFTKTIFNDSILFRTYRYWKPAE